MRLICTSCDAQYEVDAALIPASGRDVQCSNCGATWFQEAEQSLRVTAEALAGPPREAAVSGDGLGAEAAAFFSGDAQAPADTYEDEDAQATAMVAEAPTETVAVEEPVAQEEDIAESRSDDVPDEPLEDPVGPVDEDDLRFGPEGEDAGADDDDPEPEPETRDRPEIDAAVLGILKAEAEREIAARRAATESMESQPDLGLTEPELERDPIGARTRRLRGMDEEENETAEAAVENSARKALLPDVEEINSTLTATTDRAGTPTINEVFPEETERRRSGFRLGFSLVMLLTAAAIFVYLFAPQIAEAVPALEPAMMAYVEWANAVRKSADTTLQSSIDALTTFLVELSS